MKTVNKSYQQIANIAIVQFETLTDDGFGFLPAGPAIEAGDLVIKELDHSGDVNNLLAINNTGNHYLLTDMDLLKGAKQNRVVNISVLVMPHEQRKINVSCVERARWTYDSHIILRCCKRMPSTGPGRRRRNRPLVRQRLSFGWMSFLISLKAVWRSSRNRWNSRSRRSRDCLLRASLNGRGLTIYQALPLNMKTTWYIWQDFRNNNIPRRHAA
jgi:hypothetical protein